MPLHLRTRSDEWPAPHQLKDLHCGQTGWVPFTLMERVAADTLVLRVAHIAGYRHFSLMRASAVVNCPSALVCSYCDQRVLVGDALIEALA